MGLEGWRGDWRRLEEKRREGVNMHASESSHGDDLFSNRKSNDDLTKEVWRNCVAYHNLGVSVRPEFIIDLLSLTILVIDFFIKH